MNRQTHNLTQRIARAFVTSGISALLWAAVAVVVQIGRQSETIPVAGALACLSAVGVLWAVVYTLAALKAWGEV